MTDIHDEAEARPAVRVKPLVWEGEVHWTTGDNEGWLEEANTPFGWGYAIEFGSVRQGTWIVSNTFGETLTGFDLPSAAKAAAQADYEARILAAVEAVDLRPVREALRQYINDMKYPPERDSRERRIAMAQAALALIDGEKP